MTSEYALIIFDKKTGEIEFDGVHLTEKHVKTLSDAITFIRDAQLDAKLLIGNCRMYSLLAYYDLSLYGKNPKHIKGILDSEVEKKKIVHFWVEVDDNVISYDILNGIYKMTKEEFYREFNVSIATTVSAKEHKRILLDVLELQDVLQTGKCSINDIYKSNNNMYIPEIMEKMEYIKQQNQKVN
jgi:hypothetical protein